MNICDKNPNINEKNILRNLANFQNFTDFYSACDKNVNICDEKLKI